MSPINKIVLVLISICVICAGGIVYFKLKKTAAPAVASSTSSTKKKHTHKVTPQKDLPPIVEDTEEDEKTDAFTAQTPAKKYLLGLTLGYDFDKMRVTYNVMAGKAITDDCYAIAKLSTDLNLSHAEAGALCTY